MSGDNPTGDPDNQQGRLEAYLCGFADGEGTFSVGLTRRSDLRFGFQLVPEFRVSQNVERSSVLEIFRDVLGCGSIRENDRHRRNDRSRVLDVRCRADLLEKVIPFFERNRLLSEKRHSFETFSVIVGEMAAGSHHSGPGFERLVRLAFSMNGQGGYRRWRLEDVLGFQNPQRLHAEGP